MFRQVRNVLNRKEHLEIAPGHNFPSPHSPSSIWIIFWNWPCTRVYILKLFPVWHPNCISWSSGLQILGSLKHTATFPLWRPTRKSPVKPSVCLCVYMLHCTHTHPAYIAGWLEQGDTMEESLVWRIGSTSRTSLCPVRNTMMHVCVREKERERDWLTGKCVIHSDGSIKVCAQTVASF